MFFPDVGDGGTAMREGTFRRRKTTYGRSVGNQAYRPSRVQYPLVAQRRAVLCGGVTDSSVPRFVRREEEASTARLELYVYLAVKPIKAILQD